MKLTVEFVAKDGPHTSTAEPSSDDVALAAKGKGYSATITDPDYATKLDAMLVEFHGLAANSPERAAKGQEINAYQRAGAQQIPNPETAEEFLVNAYLADMTGLFVDQNAIQAAAQAAADEETQNQRVAAKGKLNAKRDGKAI